MKKPKDRRTPIDLRRFRGWVNEFASFRHQIGEARIRDWINAFECEHHDIVARILDCVDFITHEQMAAAFKHILASLDGWHRQESKRKGKWRFIAYSASAGESGDTMLQKFRHANNLASSAFNGLFIHRSDILREGLGFDDTIVLVDDFVGTGDQACRSWNEIYGELLAEVGRVYLIVVAGRDKAMERIGTETNLEVISYVKLDDSDNVFSPKCQWFSLEEQGVLLDYCSYVDSENPMGHGDCGLLLVFSHTIPNNTIPILGKRSPDWEPLFCRYD